jgi:hypothetical protein
MSTPDEDFLIRRSAVSESLRLPRAVPVRRPPARRRADQIVQRERIGNKGGTFIRLGDDPSTVRDTIDPSERIVSATAMKNLMNRAGHVLKKLVTKIKGCGTENQNRTYAQVHELTQDCHQSQRGN